jgi:hypothetical protein
VNIWTFYSEKLFALQDFSKKMEWLTSHLFKEKLSLSNFLEEMHVKLLDIGNITMDNQQLSHRHVWHQSCFSSERETRAAVAITQVQAMAKLFGWAKKAGNQGAALFRRTPPARIRDTRAATPGEDPARSAATMGLVSPSGGIVLWDEWHAALRQQGDGESPETPGKPASPANSLCLQHTKEVKRDPKNR